MKTVEIRTYELFDIYWDRGSRWTGYQTEADAQAVIDSAAAHAGDSGRIVRRTWDVTIPNDPRLAALYQPGCATRLTPGDNIREGISA